MPAAQQQYERALDALGNPVRRQILTMLAQNPTNVSTIASAFPISRPAISRHLALLELSGFVSPEQRGTQRIYRINERGFDISRDWLNSFWDSAEARLKLVAENTFKPDDAK